MTLQMVPSEPARPAFPTVTAPADLADRLDATHPAIVLPQQLLLAQERAAWLGAELRAQVAREGVDGVVGKSYVVTVDGNAVQVGEFARVLFEQEARERDRAASLAERIARLGLEQRGISADTARWMVAAIRALLGELGIGEDDDTLHAARRAGLAGRRVAGHDDGEPDVLVGPRLSAEARVRVLREALASAEREAEQQPYGRLSSPTTARFGC